MIFEIINPSDAVTLESDDPLVAAMATLVLSRGTYGLTDENDESVLPIFLFGGSEDWLKGHGIEDLGTYIDENWEAMAAVLETAVVGKMGKRKGIVAACEASGGDVKKALAAWNEQQRTSMTDICGSAFKLAEHLRKKYQSPEEVDGEEMPSARAMVLVGP